MESFSSYGFGDKRTEAFFFQPKPKLKDLLWHSDDIMGNSKEIVSLVAENTGGLRKLALFNVRWSRRSLEEIAVGTRNLE